MSPERIPERDSAEPPPACDRRQPLVEVVVPVHNEQAALPASIRRLHAYLSEQFPVAWRVTIADNASTDDTWTIAQDLAAELDRVRAARLDVKGRGRALRATWSTSESDVVAYMDVDLSTGLEALLPLVAPLLSGHSELATGSRLRSGARVVRGAKREFISRAYNRLLRMIFRTSFVDAQCGFKAARTDVVKALLPAVENNHWFFDTELLLLAERNGLRIHEVPVDWVEDLDSRVDVIATAVEDLHGIRRVAGRILAGRARVSLPPPRAGGEPALARRRCRPITAVRASVGFLLRHGYALFVRGHASESFASEVFAVVADDPPRRAGGGQRTSAGV